MLSLEYLGHRNIPISELIGKGKNQISFAEVPIPRATEYAAEDADMTLRLKGCLEPELAGGGFEGLFREMELPLVPVLAAMEREGVAVDRAALGELWAEVTSRTGRERAEAGVPISTVSYRIVVRSAPVGAPSRPLPEQRFRDGARLFIIQAVSERDPDGRFLICFADEEVAS